MTLEVESGFTLDPSPEITSFRQNILSGNWLDVNELLQREYFKYCDQSDQAEYTPCQLSPTSMKHESCDSRISQSLFGVDGHVLKVCFFLYNLVSSQSFLRYHRTISLTTHSVVVTAR